MCARCHQPFLFRLRIGEQRKGTIMPRFPSRLEGSLFRAYFLVLFSAVVVPLLAAGASEAWFGYRDQRERLNDLLGAEARLAATRIQDFIDSIKDQMLWTVQLPWTEAADERRRIDALRLIRQVPAVMSVRLIDREGKERLFVSRIGLNRIESGIDCREDPAFVGARAAHAWYGPVIFHRDTEPFMTVAIAGNRAAVGVVAVEINLKLILDVISAIRVGETGGAFVLDGPGRLIAHPDISLVLRGSDDPAVEPLRGLRAAVVQSGGQAVIGHDWAGRAAVATMAAVPGPDWSVLVHQPLVEAFRPIYAVFWRMVDLLIAGTLLAGILAYWQAARMTGPIRLLEQGAERIGAGHFEHRIDIATGDELERLAARFNEMARELTVAQDRSERIDRLKRFLAPQVAELVDSKGSDSLLEGRRMEVVVVFVDLRGFTAFSARAEPETIMGVLSEYYEALSATIMRHGATLTNLSGDGLMVLVNAPVPCPDPALQAIRLVLDMRAAGQGLVADWRVRGHHLGFGIGLAMGPATVGRIGSHSRLDYTAIGHVVNLASRLCACASDSQILVDAVAAASVWGRVPLAPLEPRVLKGIDEPVAVFEVTADQRPGLTEAASELRRQRL
jgi:adenylate cyclase